MVLKVDVIRYTVDGDKIIAVAAKRSLSRRDFDVQFNKMSDDEVSVWIKETFKRQHFSPWEHSSYTWTVEGCSRVCSHQLVRHRIASFTQLSMRYSKLGFDKKCLSPRLYEDRCVSICPLPKNCVVACFKNNVLELTAGEASARILVEGEKARVIGKKESKDPIENSLINSWLIDMVDVYPPPIFENMIVPSENLFRRYCRMIDFVIPPSLYKKKDILAYYMESVSTSFLLYRYMVKAGIPAEDARFLIPMGVETKLVVTMNARELIQSFLPLRMCTKAQWEIRVVAWLLWSKLLRIHPRLFKYAGPRCIFYENAIRKDPITLEELMNGVQLVMDRCPENIDRKGISKCVKSNLVFLDKIGYSVNE